MDIKDMLNIRDLDIESVIKDVINKSKNDLNGLINEQTCLIWSSKVYEELRNKHINVSILSTEDIDGAYIHYFNIVPYESDYYVIDLTFKQFNSNSFPDLTIFGYELMNIDNQKDYLKIVTQKKNIDCSFDDLLFKTSNKTIN